MERALVIIGGLILLLVTILQLHGTTGIVLAVLGVGAGIALIAWLVVRVLRKRSPREGGGFWLRARVDVGIGHPPRK